MSKSHSRTKLVEATSRRLLSPVLRDMLGGNEIIFVDKCGGSRDIQFLGIDGFGVHAPSGKQLSFELKAEEKDKHGNLFLETWSNKSTYRNGWVYTSKSDKLVYHFIEDGKAFVLDTKRLRLWVCGSIGVAGEFHQYREVPQKKHEQENDTWGRPVPIEILKDRRLITMSLEVEPGVVDKLAA